MRRFQQKTMEWEHVRDSIISDMRVYLQVTLTVVEDTPASRSLLTKLGISAQFKERGAARDENGEVLFAYTSSRGARSVMYQELKAIEQGLQKCKDFIVKKLVVVSDSLRAINALNNKENAS
ncbi:hypothetical protein IFM89_007249, partial [Coptis chinensis]